MKKIFYTIFVCLTYTLQSQTITPQVINSAGMHYPAGINGVYLTDNIGEPFVQSSGSGSLMLTEGFLQPFNIPTILTGDIIKNDVTCKGKNDGNISIALTSNISGYTVKYIWSPPAACPGNDCSSLDSLKPGTYAVTVHVTYTLAGVVKTDSSISKTVTIEDINGPCLVKIFNGVTPNGDGINDVWAIENISEFPKNSVQIYTRWGEKIYEENGYNNIDKSWPRKDDLSNLISSTYFYIILLGDGTPPLKGWVELIKN